MTDKLPKCITTSFDPNDDFEKSLARHVVSKGNRSRYIKRLIYNDMMQVREMITATVLPEIENEDKDSMESFF